MPILLVGMNHRCGSLRSRERLAALGPEACLKALLAGGWREAVVLSTCNRFEVYAVRETGASPKGAAGLEGLTSLLDAFAGESVSGETYRLQGADCVRHLFGVASGLDSLVVGESEILGQVKGAYEAALALGSTGRLTNTLFQRALFVGKKVRSSTRIGMGQTSTASVAVELARRIFGNLRGSQALLLGAGDMARKTARHLLESKVGKVLVANRTWENGRALASELGEKGVECLRWEDFPERLGEVDMVISSTGSPSCVLTREMVARALSLRRGRSLFLIDIAMPRDVEEEVGSLEGAYLYALSDLEAVVAENLSCRLREVEAAGEIVREEAQAFFSRGPLSTVELQARPIRP